LTIKKLKSIDIINVLSDLVSKKLETTVKLPNVKMNIFYVLFYSFVFGGSEFHEMNNQNRQVPLDGYSPHEALQELAFLQAF